MTQKSISQRQLINDYNKMILNFPEDPEFKIKENIYTCEGCKNVVKTKDLAAGTTPMKITCLKCGGAMQSNFYADIPKDPEVSMEWYRPTLKQVLKWRGKPGLIDHILNGGLSLRQTWIEREKNVLEIAIDALRSLQYKEIPEKTVFYTDYTRVLKEALGLNEEGGKSVMTLVKKSNPKTKKK